MSPMKSMPPCVQISLPLLRSFVTIDVAGYVLRLDDKYPIRTDYHMINLCIVSVTPRQQHIIYHHIRIRQSPQLPCHGKLTTISCREQTVSARVIAVLAPAAERQMNQQQKQQERTCYYEVWSEHVILLWLPIYASQACRQFRSCFSMMCYTLAALSVSRAILLCTRAWYYVDRAWGLFNISTQLI